MACAIFALSFISCGNKTTNVAGASDSDTITVDSLDSDSVSVDSLHGVATDSVVSPAK